MTGVGWTCGTAWVLPVALVADASRSCHRSGPVSSIQAGVFPALTIASWHRGRPGPGRSSIAATGSRPERCHGAFICRRRCCVWTTETQALQLPPPASRCRDDRESCSGSACWRCPGREDGSRSLLVSLHTADDSVRPQGRGPAIRSTARRSSGACVRWQCSRGSRCCGGRTQPQIPITFPGAPRAGRAYSPCPSAASPAPPPLPGESPGHVPAGEATQVHSVGG